MVNLKEVRISNQSLQALPPGLVGVFIGATEGIGLATLRQFTRYANGPHAIIIGRSASTASPIIDNLKTMNPMSTCQFIEAKVSHVHEVDRIFEDISKYVDHIDFLCMSPSYLTSFDIEEAREDINTGSASALEHYARIRLTISLFPLLKLSVSPRVISIFGTGSEGALDPRNLNAVDKIPDSKAIAPIATLIGLTFEELAKLHPTISFVNSYPGWIGTPLLDQSATSPGVWWTLSQIPRFTIYPILRILSLLSASEAGERALFLATSVRYPPSQDHEKAEKLGGWAERPQGVTVARPTVVRDGRGNGVYSTDWSGNEKEESPYLAMYRKTGVGKRILDHTRCVFAGVQ